MLKLEDGQARPHRKPQTSVADHLVGVPGALRKDGESEADQVAGSTRMKHPMRSTAIDVLVGMRAAGARQRSKTNSSFGSKPAE